MPNMTLQEAYEIAVRHHEAGQLDEADGLYRQILGHAPNHADSIHLLGVIAGQRGQVDEGIELIRRAISIEPSPQYMSNLGGLLARRGKLDEAIALYRHALSMRPDFVEARGNLASALTDNGMVAESLEEYRRVVAEKPDWPDGFHGLGTALMADGKLDEAISYFRRAIELRPNYVEALTNLSNALRLKGQSIEAIDAARRAVAHRPDFVIAWHNLGTALHDTGQIEPAIDAYRRALAIQPDYVNALYNLGAALQESGRLEQAIEYYRKALAIRADHAEVYGNLGNALKDSGQIDEALNCYRRAVSLNVECKATNNLLYALHFHPDWGPREIYQEHLRWSRTYAAPLSESIRPHDNDPSPDRRLKLGLVSGDFTFHPVGRFLFPLLANFDGGAFEIYCYSDVRRPDVMTEWFKSKAHVWRTTQGLSDEQLAQQVRQDRIDILVDLSLHADGSRLLVFARKPAPVQVTYLAYCSTSGLSTMDYRISDPYLDPRAIDDSAYSEKTVRLPHSYWCYVRPAEALEVNPLPALSAGHITFGCLNNYAKVSEPTLRMWSMLLREISDARLMVFSREGPHRSRATEIVTGEGVDPKRFLFVDAVATPQYFRRYQEIDIALDPFPFCGGTTTCDSLWMGVPVVSLAGATAVSRAGLSILSNVGLPELVARTPEQYVKIASDLARDLPRLAELRSTLRDRMLRSPLMDAPGFARDISEAFRQMWRNWCNGRTASL